MDHGAKAVACQAKAPQDDNPSDSAPRQSAAVRPIQQRHAWTLTKGNRQIACCYAGVRIAIWAVVIGGSISALRELRHRHVSKK
jgi:hypothetical protein